MAGNLFFYYWYRVSLAKNGYRIAEADGSCNSWEGKYRFRQAERSCPKCKKETIRKSKQAGWYCWAKIGGCGAQFKDGDPAIEKQDLGKVKNPNPADLVNTVQKMALKRALVAAALIGVNASEYFTQDVEDFQAMDMPFREESKPEPAKEPESSKGKGRGKDHPKDKPNSNREEYCAELRQLMTETSTNEVSVLEYYKISTLEEASQEQLDKLMNILLDRKASMD